MFSLSLHHWASIGLILTAWIHMMVMIGAQGPSSTVPTVVQGSTVASTISNALNCSNVRTLLESRGIATSDIPVSPINEMVLRYCDNPTTGTCCTYSIEMKLASTSRTQLERNTKESIGKLSSVLGTRASKFNDFFKELLTESRAEFHEMFKRTYGVIYEQNSYVFSDLFNELESYYARGKVDLAEAMDSFFNTLYQKMFTVLNSQYSFDDKYLGCVSEHMKELKPFGDVPEKLTGQVKRSFVATRTFEQALAAAAEVARNMQNVRPNAECTAALTKMQQCGACKGLTQKPCNNYCVNVMKGCLNHYKELDAEWDNFVQSMEKISDRLLGPFNIVMVVEPINIKISEAIMNFQETGADISQQVFHGCGRPQLGRRRRRSINPRFRMSEEVGLFDDGINAENIDEYSLENGADNFSFDDGPVSGALSHSETASVQKQDRIKRNAALPSVNSGELELEPLTFSSKKDTSNDKGRKKNKNRQPSATDSNDNKDPLLDQLVKDIRQKVKDSRKFWSNLPYQICNNEEFSAPSSSDADCWNGNSVDRYQHIIATDISSNPEFPQGSAGTKQSSVVSNQLFTLRNIVAQLRNAFNGHDVEWTDVEEPYYGSGSGSGAGIDDEDDTGSGLGPYDPHIEETDDEDEPRIAINKMPGKTVNVPVKMNNTISSSSPGAAPPTVDKDSDIYLGKPIEEVDNDISHIGSGASDTQPMSIRRAMLTYFVPIYLAWFGGIVCELL